VVSIKRNSITIGGFLCLLVGSCVFADSSIRAKLLYEVEILGPAIIEPCANRLWVYSVGEKELWEMDPKTGNVETKTSLSRLQISGAVTALGCQDQKLLAASFDKSSRTVYFHHFVTPSKIKTHILSEKSLVRDIFCSASSCYLIRDKVYQSRNFDRWTKVPLQSSADIPKRKLEKEHFFSNWQDQFLVAKGSYFRGLAMSDQKLLLLDAVRSGMVTYDKRYVGKWESWGFRKGSLLFPKGLALLSPDILVISDVGLKLISFFDLDGKYLGSIGADGKGQRFGYPIDIAVIGNTVYSVDFFANKLQAFMMEMIFEVKSIAPLFEIQENLFRHPDVAKYFSETRCLNCHDGLQTYTLERFLNMKERFNHPHHVKVQQKTVLPLWSGGEVDCFSCHHSHHEAPAGKTVSQFGNIQSVTKLPYQFRKSLPGLCLECHPEKGLKDQNHFHIKRERLSQVKASQVVSCDQCHKMHQSNAHLLKKKAIELCTTCHGQSQIPQSHPIPYGDTEVACLFCHTTHDAKKELHFSRASGKGAQEVCLGCHQDKKEMMGVVEHLKIDPKREAYAWPGQEAACLKCHHPHDKRPHTTELCLSCHQDRKATHHEKNLAVLLKKNEGQVLKNLTLEEGKLSCATCHDPHNFANIEKYLRPRQEDIKVACRMCHGSEGLDQRFQNYHVRQKKRGGS